MNRRAQAHAKRVHTCPRCGKVCHGNGYANHRRMHQRERLRAAGVPEADIGEITRDSSLEYADERIEGIEHRAEMRRRANVARAASAPPTTPDPSAGG